MIKLKDLTVSYGNKIIFDDFNGELKFNNLNVLIGKNGIGKSTLLDVISGLKKVDKGVVENVPNSNRIMYMFQSIPFNTNVTVTQLINMYKSFGKLTSFEEYNIKGMDKFFRENILPLANMYLGDLSGGERKLVFTYTSAMVLKSLYIFDEPLSGVDIENRQKIVKLLENLGLHVAVIVTTHELEPFKETNSTLKYISKDRFIFSGSYKQLTQKYGRSPEKAFLALTDEMRKKDEKY